MKQIFVLRLYANGEEMSTDNDEPREAKHCRLHVPIPIRS